MKLLYSRRVWFAVLLVLISTMSILLYNYFSVLIDNWFDTLKYAIAIVGLLATLYTYWRKFNLFITRVRIILFNSSSKWNVQSVLEGNFNNSIQNKIKQNLLSLENATSFNLINDKAFSINIDGLHYIFDFVEVADEELLDTHGKIICRIDDFYCSYDKSIDIFQDKITPLFRTLEKETNAKKCAFTFKIHFNGQNPFLSLIAKNINPKNIHHLWYSYDDKTKQGRKSVKVTERVLECTTTDITDFQRSSVNFISLVGD